MTEATAIVQAIAAVAIVVLTIVLAVIAYRANGEARRTRALQAVPIIGLHEPTIDISETGAVRWAITTLELTNGSVPAFDIRIQLKGVAIPGLLPERESAASHVAALAPGQTMTIRPDVRGLGDQGLSMRSNTDRDADKAFLYHFIEVTVECSGVLGALVSQVYGWAPNAEPGDGNVKWRIKELNVSGPALETIHHRYPDEDERWEAELRAALGQE